MECGVQVTNVVSLEEKMSVLTGFPFFRALCEIPLTILASQTDADVFSKYLKETSDFIDLALSK